MPELTHSAERPPPPVLASLLPAAGEKLSSDQILDRFVSFAAGAGLSLYPAQEEALELASAVVVMRRGRVEQTAPPVDIYNRPATPFVAGFVGASDRSRRW